MLFLAGCTSPQAQTQASGGANSVPTKTCKNVTKETPTTTTQCGPVAYTEEACGTKKLSYDAVLLPKVTLCTVDGPCVGETLEKCTTCAKAMTRCVLSIRNTDVQSGTWTAAANFTLPGYGFIKDPITKTILPNTTETFDFFQFYAPGLPVNSADCNVYVTAEAVADSCHQETRTKTECANVTTMVTTQSQVCS